MDIWIVIRMDRPLEIAGPWGLMETPGGEVSYSPTCPRAQKTKEGIGSRFDWRSQYCSHVRDGAHEYS